MISPLEERSTRRLDHRLHIRLLGGLGVSAVAGEPLLLPGKRQRLLLAYLLLHRDTPSDRKHVAFLFWPESTEAQALTNLRQLIHDLRAALPGSDRFVEAGRQVIRWRTDAAYDLDVDHFERAVAAGMQGCGTDDPVTALSRAVELYSGDLIPECYDEWIEPLRTRLREQVTSALRRLILLLEEQREYSAARAHAERLLGLEPLDETTVLALMRLFAAEGRRADALEAYQRCAEVFQRELGVAPGPALRQLRDRLIRAESERSGAPPTLASQPLPLVGRGSDWKRIWRVWLAAREGPPRAVVVSGVAGIGKTRFAEELLHATGLEGSAVATSDCHGTVGRLPYGTVVDWLRSPSLQHAIADLPAAWRAEIARLVPEVDDAPPAAPAALGAHPEARRRLFDALVRTVLAAPQPLLLFADDIQWADQDSLEWIAYFLRAAGRARVLVLFTLRSGEVPLVPGLDAMLRELEGKGRLETITLEPLDCAATAALAAAAGQTALAPLAAEELHRETEGLPLYIVEVIRAGAAGTARPGTVHMDGATAAAPSGSALPRPLPQRVVTVIESRLARLSTPTRRAIGVAAAIGREFRLALLAEASGLSEGAAAAVVDELLERRLVRERADGSYDFSHDIIRHVAYAGMSSARRRLVHRQIASAEIASDAGSAGLASAIASHLERAGFVEGAIPYHRLAAEHALDVFAATEAVRHLEKALGLLALLPAAASRLGQEVELRTALCVALVTLEMYGPRTLEEYARVRALCDRAGIVPSPPALRIVALAMIMKGRMAEVAEIGERLLRVAPTAESPILFVEAQYLLGVTAYWCGDPRGSTRHLMAALRTYRPERAREHINLYGQDAGAICGVRLALSLCLIGRSNAARRVLDRAIEHAERIGHPHTLAYVRQFGAWVLIELGDERAARRQIEGAIELAQANTLAGWLVRNRALGGYLLARAGEIDRGIEMMRGAAAQWASRGWQLAVPYDRALLAELCLATGRVDEGIRAVEEGMSVARETGHTFWDAELLRLLAELRAASGAPVAATRCTLRQAIDIATRQRAIALARRAQQSLHRL